MPGSPCLAGHPVQRRAFLVDIDWNNGSPYANPIEVAGVSILAGASYEILFLIAGTLLTTLIAMAIAVTIAPAAQRRPCKRSPQAGYATGTCAAAPLARRN